MTKLVIISNLDRVVSDTILSEEHLEQQIALLPSRLKPGETANRLAYTGTIDTYEERNSPEED